MSLLVLSSMPHWSWLTGWYSCSWKPTEEQWQLQLPQLMAPRYNNVPSSSWRQKVHRCPQTGIASTWCQRIWENRKWYLDSWMGKLPIPAVVRLIHGAAMSGKRIKGFFLLTGNISIPATAGQQNAMHFRSQAAITLPEILGFLVDNPRENVPTDF